MVEVDSMNRKILNLLRTNAKMTYQEIASRLDRSPSTVRDRIRRMENDGIILGYSAVVDPEEIGLDAEAVVMANLDPEITMRDLNGLRDIDGVKEVLAVSGERAVMIRLQASSNRALDEKITEKIAPVGLVDIEVELILNSVKRFPQTPVL